MPPLRYRARWLLAPAAREGSSLAGTTASIAAKASAEVASKMAASKKSKGKEASKEAEEVKLFFRVFLA